MGDTTQASARLESGRLESGRPAPGKRVAVIVPPVVCHNLDPHTGIPFMPHMAAHLAGALRHGGCDIQILDCFGLQPNNTEIIGEFMLMGMGAAWVAEHLQEDVGLCFIYCRTIAEFIAVEQLLAEIGRLRPHVGLVLFENVQAVTSYSLRHVAEEFLGKGADLVVMGEPEDRACEIARRFAAGESFDGIPGIAFQKGGAIVSTTAALLPKDLDSLPFPAWERFPLKGYWTAHFAHAPAGSRRFLPILTSRGCPYRCTFCIAPEVNPTWRARSAKNVVDEMEHFYRALDIRDFHVSDLDPTVSDKRTQEICRELIARNLPITWKLAQGTKIETIKSERTIDLMAAAGCQFVSFSPESGSKRLLKIMNKPFDHEHALRMARKMHAVGIRMQAVFLGGVPGEEESDRLLSIAYAKELVRAGVDEISCVIFTPLPGAALSKAMNDFNHYSQCTPSPAWRKDYAVLMHYRRRMYTTLFINKLRYHPRKVARELASLVTRNFETKMEMSVYKQAKLYLLRYCPRLFPQLDALAELKAVER